jgi:hypothetical protein
LAERKYYNSLEEEEEEEEDAIRLTFWKNLTFVAHIDKFG